MVYLSCAQPADLDTVKWLIDLPTFNPNHRDLFDVTPLIYAAIYRAPPPVFQWLIARGADVNMTAKNGQNNVVCRHLMVSYPYSPDVIRMLLDAGFDLNIISMREASDILPCLELHAAR